MLMLVPALELLVLFLAAILNQWLNKPLQYKFELARLIVLWYIVLLVGAWFGGIGATPDR